MDPILAEVYSTVLPAVPYVLVAYVGIWLAFGVYAIVLGRRAKHNDADIKALKDALENRQ